MPLARRIQTPPQNLNQYATEILPGFEALYGPRAGAYYQRVASDSMAATLLSPDVTAYGSMDDGTAAALLFARHTENRTTIVFFHVLAPWRHLNVGQDLLHCALRDLTGRHDELRTDFVPFFPLEEDETFSFQGFAKISRQLMRGTAGGAILPPVDGTTIRPALPAEFPALAQVLERTYADHRERFLFPEVQSVKAARAYLTSASRGDFGMHPTNYTLGIWQDTECLGLALGSEVLPALGFVLHLAVLPEARGRGLGTALLAAITENFGREGMDYIGLGVTCDNPAVNLYKRAGFEALLQLPVFYRASSLA